MKLILFLLCLFLGCSNQKVVLDDEETYEESAPADSLDIQKNEEENNLDYEI